MCSHQGYAVAACARWRHALFTEEANGFAVVRDLLVDMPSDFDSGASLVLRAAATVLAAMYQQ